MTRRTGRPTRGSLTFGNAALLLTATSFLVPLGGLLTAPIVARAVGAAGRGEVSAAGGPSLFMVGAITLGLPEAVLFIAARQPSMTRRALAVALGLTTALGVASVGVVWATLPFLSGGSAELGRLILIATAVSIPTMWVGVLRGAASGRQMWRTVAVERVVLTVLRVGLIVGLWLAGSLDVLAAVLVSALVPAVVIVVYLGLLRRPPRGEDQVDGDRVVGPMLSYGSQMWLGSVAVSVLGRLAPLLMVPLASTTDLGLYTIAVTISDVPTIVTMTIQNTLFGSVSKENDAARVARTSRVSLLAGFVGSAIMAALVPLGIGPLFGEDFVPATGPTWLLLLAAVVGIPGFMAAGGLSAYGRPVLRSAGLIAGVAVNLVLFIVLVPILGVYGACITNVVSNLVLTVILVVIAGRILGLPVRDFLVVRRDDLEWVRRRIRDRRRRVSAS